MNFFQRVEQKYVLSEEEYKKLFNKIKKHIEKDKSYKSTVCNIYFDNNSNELIVNSLEKPLYKEKVRIRSYNTPNINDNVFLELKGKYNGVVFKRRVKVKLEDIYNYIENGVTPNVDNKQIMNEIDYVIKRYGLVPKLFLAYDRLSYCDKDNNNFRITFDTNLRSRKDDLRLEYGDCGNLFRKKSFYIMELKSLSSIPIWFINILSELKIYPKSFSKYGNIYSKEMEEVLNV